MVIEKTLDGILNTGSKVKIIRLFVSRTKDFIASGREISKLIGVSPPAVHAALKELYNQDILKRDIIGRSHIYKINTKNRNVQDILMPAFRKESSVKEDIFNFLKKKIKEKKIDNEIVSLVLYGSLQSGSSDEKSDVDISVIIKNKSAKKQIEDIFITDISQQFYDYFGVNLDSYIKTKNEFKRRLKKSLSPVSTLIKSYSVIYGKDPIDLK